MSEEKRQTRSSLAIEEKGMNSTAIPSTPPKASRTGDPAKVEPEQEDDRHHGDAIGVAVSGSSSASSHAAAGESSSVPPSIPDSGVASSSAVVPYQFASLTSRSDRYTILNHGCPQHDILRKLIRIVARPENELAELERDPLHAAVLYQSTVGSGTPTTTVRVSKNMRICIDFLRVLTRLSCCTSFLIRLSNLQLQSYETNLQQYLLRTKGLPPIDLLTMTSKLQNSRPGYVPRIDEEGFADAYQNSVTEIIEDLVNIVINATKFNPPTHFVHIQALEFAEKLLKVQLPVLRKSLTIDSDREVCLLCGDGSSDSDGKFGVLMQCESCGFWYHTNCVDLIQPPKDAFFCTTCIMQNAKLAKRTTNKTTTTTTTTQQPNSTLTYQNINIHPQAAIPNRPSTADRRDRPSSTSSEPDDSTVDSGVRKRASADAHADEPSTKRQRALDSTGDVRSSSPVVMPDDRPPPLTARSGRSSPDGSWIRMLDLKVAERLDRPTRAPVNQHSGPDEPELRAMRCDLDAAMRVIAATSQRMYDLQRRQRNRSNKSSRVRENHISTGAYDHIMRILTDPIEEENIRAIRIDAMRKDATELDSEGEIKSNTTQPTGTPVAPAASSGVPLHSSAPPSVSALESLLVRYRARHQAQLVMIQTQSGQMTSTQIELAQAKDRIAQLEAQVASSEGEKNLEIIQLKIGLDQAKKRIATLDKTRESMIRCLDRRQPGLGNQIQREAANANTQRSNDETKHRSNDGTKPTEQTQANHQNTTHRPTTLVPTPPAVNYRADRASSSSSDSTRLPPSDSRSQLSTPTQPVRPPSSAFTMPNDANFAAYASLAPMLMGAASHYYPFYGGINPLVPPPFSSSAPAPTSAPAASSSSGGIGSTSLPFPFNPITGSTHQPTQTNQPKNGPTTLTQPTPQQQFNPTALAPPAQSRARSTPTAAQEELPPPLIPPQQM